MSTETLHAERPSVAVPPVQIVTPAAARTRMLLEAPIVSTLLRLAAPNLVVNVVLIAVTASVDAYFVGQLGSHAIAGLALVFPVLMLMQQMANSSMGGAIASAVARAIGAGKSGDAAGLIIHGLIIGAVAAVLSSLALLLGGERIYAVMGGQGAILAAAVEYSNAIFAGALAYWVLSALTSAVRGTGQVAFLAAVYVAAEALHILLVPILVFGAGPIPPLGITGAGIATVVSFTASAGLLVWYLASGRTPVTLSLRGIAMERRLFRDILRVGAPMCLQPILTNVTLAALTAYAATLGATALAGFGAAVRLEYLQYPLVFGLGAAVLAMVGTSVGARQFARAARVTWTSAALAALVTGGVGLAAIIWPGAWNGLFSATPEVQAMAATYLCIAALGYPFIGLNTLSSAFQAIGQTFWPLAAVVARTLIVLAGGWLVVSATDSGLVGLALVTVGGLAVAGILIAVSFRRSMAAKEIPA
jgi:putative MATE family efflux protein